MDEEGDYNTEVAIARLHDHDAHVGMSPVDKEALSAFLAYLPEQSHDWPRL